MAYAPPAGNITSGVSFFQWINLSVQNMFFSGIIMAVWIIMIVKILSNNNGIGKAFTAASFACMIFTVLLRTIDLVSTGFMVIFIIFTGVGVVWMHYENSGGFS